MRYKLIILSVTFGLAGCKVASVDELSLKGDSSSTSQQCTAEQKKSYINQLKQLAELAVGSLSAIQPEKPMSTIGLKLAEEDPGGNSIDFSSIEGNASNKDKPTIPEKPLAVDQESNEILAVWKDGASAISKGDEIAKKLAACDQKPNSSTKSGKAATKMDELLGETSGSKAGSSDQCTCGREYVSKSGMQWLQHFCVMRQGGTKLAQNGSTLNINDPLIYNHCYQGCRQLAANNSQCGEYTWLKARKGGHDQPAKNLATTVRKSTATSANTTTSGKTGAGANCYGGNCNQNPTRGSSTCVGNNCYLNNTTTSNSYYSCQNGRCGWYSR